jgi:hypothetical protein
LKTKLGVSDVDKDNIYTSWKDVKDVFKDKVNGYVTDATKKGVLTTHVQDANKGVFDDSKIDESDSDKAW